MSHAVPLHIRPSSIVLPSKKQPLLDRRGLSNKRRSWTWLCLLSKRPSSRDQVQRRWLLEGMLCCPMLLLCARCLLLRIDSIMIRT
ncbi:hypothetical protein LWI29_014748 [Acer saccharum]|uniref:Uncharacterized protein n=1 Tax=Acer saccharum TaxID=4024 RepID=A0AA39SVM1_ACESA|nr:hypothetical protein LWI29_005799 [Acer saccharum]KAK0596340.1 hypothetical protein LWI29_014748 [Acer saccharum]